MSVNYQFNSVMYCNIFKKMLLIPIPFFYIAVFYSLCFYLVFFFSLICIVVSQKNIYYVLWEATVYFFQFSITCFFIFCFLFASISLDTATFVPLLFLLLYHRLAQWQKPTVAHNVTSLLIKCFPISSFVASPSSCIKPV